MWAAAGPARTSPIRCSSCRTSFSGRPRSGVTTAAINPTGIWSAASSAATISFAGSWVVGVEGAVSGGNINGSTTVALPLGYPGDTAEVHRAGGFHLRARPRGWDIRWIAWLLYVKGGGAWVGDKYSVVGTFAGTGFDFEGIDLRTGWTVGAGAEWAVWDNWSVRLEYDYYDFGHRSVLMSDSTNVLSGPVDVKQTVQTVKLGLSFHVGGVRLLMVEPFSGNAMNAARGGRS